MRCITIHQPWSWAIAQGYKSIENRGWVTRYRGPLLIHAGRSLKSLESGRRYIERLGIAVPADDELVFGAIVAIARLARCVELAEVEDRPFAEGPYCWMLEDVRPVESFPYSGEQGLFNVPNDVVRRLVTPEGSRLIEIESSLPDWSPGVLPLH